MSQPLRVAGFEVIISGRFWVITKVLDQPLGGMKGRMTSVDLPPSQWTISFQEKRGAPAGIRKVRGFTS